MCVVGCAVSGCGQGNRIKTWPQHLASYKLKFVMSARSKSEQSGMEKGVEMKWRGSVAA